LAQLVQLVQQELVPEQELQLAQELVLVLVLVREMIAQPALQKRWHRYQ
jgi:hypothetical protein